MECYSAVRKNGIMPSAAARRELEIILGEVSQRHTYEIPYVWN